MLSLIFMVMCWPKTLNDVYIDYDTNNYTLESLSINSEGWEDSPEISYTAVDSQYILTFCFTQYDFGALSMLGQIRIMPGRTGYTDTAADCFFGNPTVPIAIPFPENINKKGAWDGCLNAPNHTNFTEVYFSRSLDGKRGLYKATSKQSWIPELLPRAINFNGFSKENTADNPFKTSTGLYFEQKDVDNTNFYKVDNAFRNKKALSFNTKDNETQLWCDPSEKLFLFCRNHYEIWSYSNNRQVKIISSKLKCTHEQLLDKSIPFYKKFDAIGEPSMNDRGDIYFLYVFNKDDMFDADILVLKRK